MLVRHLLLQAAVTGTAMPAMTESANKTHIQTILKAWPPKSKLKIGQNWSKLVKVTDG